MDYCKDCANFNDSKRDWWYADKFYCEEKEIYVYPKDEACSKFIDKYKSSPGYTNSGCAITKLTHNILGYPDNWVVLNCFRSFREDFLKKHEEYIGILVEYDYLSPFISREIDKLDNKEIFALNILKNYLLPMANYINNNLFNEAINTYQEMISYFKNIFNLEDIEIVRPNKLDMNTLGKGRVRVKTN